MIGDIIADSLQISLRYAEILAVGIPPSDFGKLARVDGRPIISNHPAWVYGHLCLYSPRIIADVGGDIGAAGVPEGWDDLFSPRTECQDDPEGTLYPPKDRLVEQLLSSYRAASEALRATDDSLFAQDNPNERMRSKFPTLGGMENFYSGGHFMIHMGQVSAWRRMMGLGSAS
jgi:hypothetical protein